MIRGFFTGASAVLNAAERQKMIFNDLANVSTPGYRRDRFVLTDYVAGDVDRAVGRPETVANGTSIGSLTTGVRLGGVKLDLRSGPLEATQRALDVAIDGQGFFAVQTPDGAAYTRNGSFTLDKDGRLVTQQGFPVLGADGPITLAGTDPQIDPDGTVRANDQVVGRLQVVRFAETTNLIRLGDTLIKPADDAAPAAAPGQVRQGFREGSNVDVAEGMTAAMMTLRSYEASQRVVQMADEALGRAVNDIARMS